MTDRRGGSEAPPPRAIGDAPTSSASAAAEAEPTPITLTLRGDRREVEALALEFRRLARASGLDVGAVRIRSADEPPGKDGDAGGSRQTA